MTDCTEVTISIEVCCKDHNQAQRLTERVMNGNHWIGRKHGAWYFFCDATPQEILHLGQELYYELQE